MAITLEDVVKKLNDLSPNARDLSQGQIAIFGVDGLRVLGIPTAELDRLVDEIGAPSHDLANDLWFSDIYEARVLACSLADPNALTDERIDDIASRSLPWMLIDLCCLKVLSKTTSFIKKATEWSESDDTRFVYTGFRLIAIAASQMPDDDERAMGFFDRSLFTARKQASINDDRVSKSVSNALKQIGRRSREWHEAAVETCKEIAMQDSRAARWVASQSLADLLSSDTKKGFSN